RRVVSAIPARREGRTRTAAIAVSRKGSSENPHGCGESRAGRVRLRALERRGELALRHLRAAADAGLAGAALQLVAAQVAERPVPPPRRPAAPAVRLDALAQRLEQVGRLLPALGLGLGVHVLAPPLPVDHVEQRLAVGVLVLLGLERAAEAVDQVEGDRELLLRHRRLARADALRRPDLIREEHLLEDDHPVAPADAAELLLVAHHVRDDPDEARLLHRADEQRVWLLGPLRRAEVAGALEVDRVDLVRVDEILDVDRAVALPCRGLEVLVRQVDVLPLRDLVALDDLVVRDRLPLLLADLVVADSRVVLLVEEVEADVPLVDRAVHADGHVDEAERDGAGPDRPGHEGVLPVSARGLTRAPQARRGAGNAVRAVSSTSLRRSPGMPPPANDARWRAAP